jgi:hypothetical protein
MDPELQISREPVYEGHLRPDLVIKKDSMSIVIEMKRTRMIRGSLDGAIIQMTKYLKVTDIGCGIIYTPPFKANQKMAVKHLDSVSGIEIVLVTPL